MMIATPIYQQSGERQEHSLRYAIEIDAVNRRFQLCPFPDELEYAIDLIARQSVGLVSFWNCRFPLCSTNPTFMSSNPSFPRIA